MEWIIGLFVIVGIVWFIASRRGNDNPNAPTSQSWGGTFHMEGEGDFDFDIVGESQYQTALDTICGGKHEEGHEHYCTARLEREPNNPHDQNAIKVTISGRTVGYIARRGGREIAAMMDRRKVKAFTADAMIVGGWSRRSGEGHYGVKLDLPS